MWRTILLGSASLALAASAGFLASGAIGQAPTRTVTIDVGTGLQGPAGPKGDPGPPGPPGPAGPSGVESCPAGFSFAHVVFNTPSGHQTIATCLKD